jgi:D-sedoheptulose 7-phosphate isomerase
MQLAGDVERMAAVLGARAEGLAAGYLRACFSEHLDVLEKTEREVAAVFEHAADEVARALGADRLVMLCGNGGSAADAQHIAAEFTVRFVKDRRALRAIALATDSSTLTATGNDLGFDQVFSRQVEALGRAGDILIGISTSGNSENVLAALRAARDRGIATIALTGAEGGKAATLADYLIAVPSRTTARVQEMHILIGHAICGAVERRLGLAS